MGQGRDCQGRTLARSRAGTNPILMGRSRVPRGYEMPLGRWVPQGARKSPLARIQTAQGWYATCRIREWPQPRKQPQRWICPKHSRRIVRCESGSGYKTSLLPSSEVLRAALPPCYLLGRDATGGVNRRVYDLRHYPSLAKLGIGRLETWFRVVQYTACLPRFARH